MSNNDNTEETSAGIPSEFQTFFNKLDGRRETVKTEAVELTTEDGEVIELSGAIKNDSAVIKTKRKGRK